MWPGFLGMKADTAQQEVWSKLKDFINQAPKVPKSIFSFDDANIELDRIEKAGGKIIQPKTEINPDIGSLALFHDSEGNEIAIHPQN
jgi:predicted enzyme related to lactoylglutathione lyase